MWRYIKKLMELLVYPSTQSSDSEAGRRSNVPNTQVVIGNNNNAIQNNYNGLSPDEAYRIAKQAVDDQTASQEEVSEMLAEVFSSNTNSER